MVNLVPRWSLALLAPSIALFAAADVSAQQAGSLRGVIFDNDFDVPLVGAQVLIDETGDKVTTGPDGGFLFASLKPGSYTLVITKDGYSRLVRSGVVVNDGQLTEFDGRLEGAFEEMEEFVVQDLQLAGGEQALLQLRADSASLVDAISSDLMSKVGAGDAAAALRFVSGASVQDGKYAVVRGLPDRYVNSQLNGMRLPTADEDKRAVQLDQFPSNVIESIVVSKTFTPDQQGDASGGAVNVILRGVPQETVLQFKSEVSYNSQAGGRKDFLTYSGGGLRTWGNSGADRDIPTDLLGQNWPGAVGVSRDDAPIDHKWSLALGGSEELDEGVKVGGLINFFYERDSSYYANGRDDSYWVTTPGGPMVPETNQGDPSQGEFKTRLFDVEKGSQSVQWGGLGTLGVESENHSVSLSLLHTRIAEDTATLAIDTRGKEFFFPGYDPSNINDPGNDINARDEAPYTRTETLAYNERTTTTFQMRGKHRLTLDVFEAEDDTAGFLAPEFDWTLQKSNATFYEPDKRQFGAIWKAQAPDFVFPPPPFPPFFVIPNPAVWEPLLPAENFTLGNLQRIWKSIEEESIAYSFNLKVPFKQWSDSEGYFKIGVYDDSTKRQFDQETFSNFNLPGVVQPTSYQADFTQPWSEVFPLENHPINAGPPFVDVDYSGRQEISAWYAMMDLPLTDWVNVIGGARVESTELSIVNEPEADVTWFPPGSVTPVVLLPGDADVDFSQDDVLPSIGLVLKPIERVTFRATYAETVARQTFKELTPIQQQEFLGGDVFIGNPDLKMSALENYDLRVDWAPTPGSLVSVSWFRKNVERPIEYVQQVVLFTYTTPVNYPSGKLEGFEFEVRQNMGDIVEGLDGLTLGANATLLESSVRLPQEEIDELSLPNINAPIVSRDMTGAPAYLYNLFATYSLAETGTDFAIAYSVQGDTLIAGAGTNPPNFVPSVYALPYGTLNMSITQKLGDIFRLSLAIKNLTNPDIEEVYRSPYIGDDVLKTSFTRGIDFSVSLSASFTF